MARRSSDDELISSWNDQQLSTATLSPPYKYPIRFDPGLRKGRLPRGTIVLVRAPSSVPWIHVAEKINLVQQGESGCPVALWTPDISDHRQLTQIATRSVTFGIRAYLPSPSIDLTLLRSSLTDLTLFPLQLLLWMARRGFALRPALKEHIEAIAQSPLHCTTLRRFLHSVQNLHGSESRWRTEFTRQRLGSAAVWFQLLRVVRLAVTLQAQPAIPIAVLAEQLGFFDAAHLRHRISDIVGASPTIIRAHLGWEWMMSNALRRHGIRAPGVQEI